MSHEEKLWPAGKRLAALQAEMNSRLAALEGGDSWERHGHHIRYVATEIWEIKNSEGDRR